MTKLPEPNFIERDADRITQEWIDLYEEKTGKTLQPAQIERILIDVGAYRENLLRIQIQETAKSNLLTYAPLEVLEHMGELVGVSKIEAKYSKTVIEFSLDESLNFDVYIPQGTEVETYDGKYIFATDETVVLSSGTLSVSVNATCKTSGVSPNGYTSGQINNLLSFLEINFDTVSNTETSYGGAEEESADSLRERIRLAPESFSNAGSIGAYKFHTLSAHQDITDVEILSSSAGTVDIYPLTKTGNPSDSLITLISDYLNADKIRPLTDRVIVHKPERIDFEINATIILFLDADLNTVQTIINSSLNKYKTEMSSKLGKDIVPSQIIALLNSVYGVYKVELTSLSYRELQKNQWGYLTGWNITFGGYADE